MSNLQIQMIPAPKGMKLDVSTLDQNTGRYRDTGILNPNVYALRTVRDLDTEDDLNEASEWTEVMDCNGKWHRLGYETVGTATYSRIIGIDINGWDKDIDDGVWG